MRKGVKELGGNTYFSNDEETDMVSIKNVINAIPYFNYISDHDIVYNEKNIHEYIQRYLYP